MGDVIDFKTGKKRPEKMPRKKKKELKKQKDAAKYSDKFRRKTDEEQRDSTWNFNERISRIRNSLDRIHLLMAELKSLQNNRNKQCLQ